MFVVSAILGGFLLGRLYSEVQSCHRKVALRHLIRAYHG